MFNIMNIVIDLLIGAASGWLVANLMNIDSTNMIFNCFLGIIGSIVGGLLAGLIGFSAHGILANVILSVIGGCIVVWGYHKIKG